MKCFYDNSQEAIGTCKSCGKGLSENHYTDLGKGLACKDRCESDVRDLIELVEMNISMTREAETVIQGASRNSLGSAIFFGGLGGAFLFFGLFRTIDYFIVIGLLFVGYGLFLVFRARQMTMGARSRAEQIDDGNSVKPPGDERTP